MNIFKSIWIVKKCVVLLLIVALMMTQESHVETNYSISQDRREQSTVCVNISLLFDQQV